MAQMTRSGYVYVISNIGSFGGDVIKIGLTRTRGFQMTELESLEMLVFLFGLTPHAMIYSDDAPGLEAALHKVFSDRRVNEAN